MIFDRAAVPGEEDGIVSTSEPIRLPFMSDEPLEAWSAGTGPDFDISHHEGLRKAIKNAH
jgi:hypothetical protein